MGRYLDICNEVTRDNWAKRAAALLAQVHDKIFALICVTALRNALPLLSTMAG